jgi:hypothetical protein
VNLAVAGVCVFLKQGAISEDVELLGLKMKENGSGIETASLMLAISEWFMRCRIP